MQLSVSDNDFLIDFFILQNCETNKYIYAGAFKGMDIQKS